MTKKKSIEKKEVVKRELRNLLFEIPEVMDAFKEVFTKWFGPESSDGIYELHKEIKEAINKYTDAKQKILDTLCEKLEERGQYKVDGEGLKAIQELQQQTVNIKTPKIYILKTDRDASGAKITAERREVLEPFVEFVDKLPKGK